jgi:hypothetical protein
MDRATIGIMTASLVIGSSIVMMIPGGADPVRGIAAHLLRAGGLSGRIREQPVGYLFDLAPPTAMTERAQPVDAVRCAAGVPVLAHIGSARSKLIGPLFNEKPPCLDQARQRRIATPFIL